MWAKVFLIHFPCFHYVNDEIWLSPLKICVLKIKKQRGWGEGIKIGLFLHATKFQFFHLVSSPICLLDCVIQDIVQKDLFFFRYRQL